MVGSLFRSYRCTFYRRDIKSESDGYILVSRMGIRGRVEEEV